MLRTKLRREPAFLGRRRHRGDTTLLQQLQPADDPGPLVVGAARDGADDRQPVDPVRVAPGKRLCDQAAERKTRKVALLDAARVPDVANIRSKVVKRAGGNLPRLAVAAQIKSHDCEKRLEKLRDFVPGLQVCTDAVDQGYIGALA